IKYSDPGKPDRYVEVSSQIDGDGWGRIAVRDNGVGIPPPALPSIFQPFSPGHADREDLSHVTGVVLGLAIVDDCVRGMGGHVDVHSVEHEGTIFTLILPRTPSVKQAPVVPRQNGATFDRAGHDSGPGSSPQ